MAHSLYLECSGDLVNKFYKGTLHFHRIVFWTVFVIDYLTVMKNELVISPRSWTQHLFINIVCHSVL